MLKIMAFLTKRQDIATRAFIEDPSIDFDVVTELVFPDRAAYLAWGAQLSASTAGEPVISEDELKFLDRSRTRAYVVEEHVTPE